MSEERAIVLKLSYASIRVYPVDEITFETCFGCAVTRGRRCHNRIAQAVRYGSQATLRDVVAGATLSAGRMRILAASLLCRRYHQNQADDIEDALVKALTLFRVKSSPVPAPPIPRSLPASRPIPVASTPLGLSDKYPAPVTVSPSHANTAHAAFKTRFESYKLPAGQIEQLLTNLANSRLTQTGSEPGYIYMFRYYSDTGVKGPIKIGYSNDVHRRMGEIRRSCGQTPIVITDREQRPIKHVYRAARLVFTLLLNYRRQIRLCEGCGKTHTDWFEIDEVSAVQVVEKVRQFMEDRYGRVSLDGVRYEGAAGSGQDHIFDLVEMARQLDRSGKISVSGPSSRSDDVPRRQTAPTRSPSLRDTLESILKYLQQSSHTPMESKPAPDPTYKLSARATTLASDSQEIRRVGLLERERQKVSVCRA